LGPPPPPLPERYRIEMWSRGHKRIEK
jgi:hypothetical protein